MKKIILVLLLIAVSLVTFSIKEPLIEAQEPVLYDFYCDTPRFMYSRDIAGEVQPLDCSVRVLSSKVYEADLPEFDIQLVSVDQSGNLLSVINNFEVNFERDSDVISSGIFNFIITDDEKPEIFSLKDEISGEVIEVDKVVNYTTGLELPINDWRYFNDTGHIAISTENHTLGDRIDIYVNKYDSTSYEYNMVYDTFSQSMEYSKADLRFLGEGAPDNVFYQFRIEGEVIYNGMIIPSPSYTPNKVLPNPISIDFGRYYIDDTVLDFDDMSNYTLSIADDYFLLHYEKDPNFSETLYIKFYDIKTSTITDMITTADIFNYQGGSTNEIHRSFIPLMFNGGELPALNSGSTTHLNIPPSNIVNFNLPEGVYLIVMENAGGVLYDYSDYLLIVDDNGVVPFKIDLLLSSLDLNSSQRVDFYKYNSILTDAFTTTSAKDLGTLNDYTTEVENMTSRLNVSFKPLETLVNGDIVSVEWVLEPSSLPHSIDPSIFEINLRSRYTIADDEETDQQIMAIINYWGLSDEEGLLFVSIMILFIVNIVLIIILKNKGYIVYAIVNAGLLLILSVLGMLVMWVGIGVGLLIVMLIMFNFNATRSDEL